MQKPLKNLRLEVLEHSQQYLTYLILSILLVFDKYACHSRWFYQFTPHDARKLIDHRTLPTLYLQTRASHTRIILYQITALYSKWDLRI